MNNVVPQDPRPDISAADLERSVALRDSAAFLRERRRPWLAPLVLLCVAASVIALLLPRAPRPQPVRPAPLPPPVVAAPRTGVTFILGEDHSSNRYYERAAHYYRTDRYDRTEYVITDCRTLRAAHDWLAANRPRNGQPWGIINFVAHGNEWTGIGVPVDTGWPQQTGAAQLAEAVAAAMFTPLPDTHVDGHSLLQVHGCAVGNPNEFVVPFVRLFRSASAMPALFSSRKFVLFDAETYNGVIVRSSRAEADYWYAFHPAGQRPGDTRLANQLHRRYPDAGLDWRGALTRTAPRHAGDPFHTTFTIPVVWTATLAPGDTVPPLATRAQQQAWLQAQTELQAYLAQAGFSSDECAWSFAVKNDAADKAVVATGKTTVVCILRALPPAWP